MENNQMEQNTSAEQDCLQERLELAWERIAEIPEEHFGAPAFEEYFARTAEFLLLIKETDTFLRQGGLTTAPIEELARRNHQLYEDITPEHYADSYANPTVAVQRLGKEHGQLLSFLYTELRSLIGFVYEGRMQEVAIRLELFVEVYGAYTSQWQEQQTLPVGETVRQILYWFVSDYADMAAEESLKERRVAEDSFAIHMIQDSDLSDERYLYGYGSYIGDNERQMAQFLNSLPQETIASMADPYTEGFRMGFVAAGKNLDQKKTVELHYPIGFERVMRLAIENFGKMGLTAVGFRDPASALYGYSMIQRGFFSTDVNKQMRFDHKDDRALYLDKAYVNRRIEVMQTAYEAYRQAARDSAGPAVVETFGEATFEPVNKPENLRMSDEQNRLWVEYRSRTQEQRSTYEPEEETSFTIIAFPIPEIGDCFPELFQDTIRINTLDYKLYQGIQQTIIDVLDTADYCEIKGMGDNRTDLKVNLWKLADPTKETIFENCVADVNIPVGEVFTSPVLEGTNGLLHVTRVYLQGGLEYKNLAITFENGMIKDYTCDNFATEEENRAFIKENILNHHDTLPIGEFAIGTNTTAYRVAQKYNVANKFPILIAEKTGPHFAVGDTCYSYEEDIMTYNPDGKAIVARENTCSAKRDTNPTEAYYSCHTDITIPYDELGELTAVRTDGTRIPIIQNGRFTLPGTAILNVALEEV